MSDPKSKQTIQLEEVDLLKFQLLAAYLGMRSQDVKLVEQEQIIAGYRKKEVEILKDSAQTEVLKYQNVLKDKYQLGSHDLVDYATGQIQRGNPDAHRIKIEEDQDQTKENQEENQNQTKEKED